jgi:hypothetical protein
MSRSCVKTSDTGGRQAAVGTVGAPRGARRRVAARADALKRDADVDARRLHGVRKAIEQRDGDRRVLVGDGLGADQRRAHRCVERRRHDHQLSSTKRNRMCVRLWGDNERRSRTEVGFENATPSIRMLTIHVAAIVSTNEICG